MEMADRWLLCARLPLAVLMPGCGARHKAGGKGWDAQPVVWVRAAVASLMLGLGELL